MNIFSKVTLQGLKRNHTRTIVTIIGVVLSVAMITAVTSFISSMQSYLLELAIASDGDWHAKYVDVDADFVGQLENDDKINSIARVQNIGYAKLDGGKNEYKPYLFIEGFNDKALDTLPITLTEGRFPENGGEIVIPEHIKSNGGVEFSLGDMLTLEIGSRTADGYKLTQNNPFLTGDEQEPPETFTADRAKAYTVVGFCKRPSFEPFSAPGYTVITKEEPADSSIDSYDVYLKVKNLSKIYTQLESATSENQNGAIFNNEYLRAAGVSNNESYNTILYSMGAILIGLIMIGGILLIYNSFSISVSERTRQFGILSSVGATKKQLRKSVLFEGACIGLIGIPLGVLAGVGGIGVTLKFVGGIFDSMVTVDVPLKLTVSLTAIIIAALLGITTILISAYIPAKKAAKRSAIDSIRQTHDIKIKAKSVKTGALTLRLFGLPGMLARKNFKRNKKRYRTTVISLFVSIVLFISASAFGMYLKQGTDMTLEANDYDIAIGSSTMSDEEVLDLYEKLKSADSVTKSGYQMETTFSYCVTADMLTDKFREFAQVAEENTAEEFNMICSVFFISDENYLSYLKELGLPESEYTGAGAKLPAVAKVQGYDYAAKRTRSFDLFNKTGNISLNITPYVYSNEEPGIYTGNPADTEAREVTFTLIDKKPFGFQGSNHTGITTFAPYSLLDDFQITENTDQSPMLIFKSSDAQKTTADMEIIFKECNIDSSMYSMFNIAEMQQANRSLLLVINVFTYGFIILMSLITVANVFNTISTNIALRRREFAMLRSVGMADKGFNRMMNYECLFYGVKALLYGLPVAIGITFLIFKSMVSGVDMNFTLPWSSIGISIFGVFFVVFVTMLYSVSKLKKENTVDALKSDMM